MIKRHLPSKQSCKVLFLFQTTSSPAPVSRCADRWWWPWTRRRPVWGGWATHSSRTWLSVSSCGRVCSGKISWYLGHHSGQCCIMVTTSPANVNSHCLGRTPRRRLECWELRDWEMLCWRLGSDCQETSWAFSCWGDLPSNLSQTLFSVSDSWEKMEHWDSGILWQLFWTLQLRFVSIHLSFLTFF